MKHSEVASPWKRSLQSYELPLKKGEPLSDFFFKVFMASKNIQNEINACVLFYLLSEKLQSVALNDIEIVLS